MVDSASRSTASCFAITLNLITAGFGSGLLTMPWGTAGSSIFVSLLLLMLVFALNGWLVYVLVTTSEMCKTYQLGALMSRLPWKMGTVLQIFADVVVFVSQFLVLLGYTIIVVAAFQRLLPDWGVVTSRPVLSILMGVLMCPLSLLDQRRLACTSSVTIVSNLYIAALVISYAWPFLSMSGWNGKMAADFVIPKAELEDSARHLCLWGVSSGSITNFSLMIFALNTLMLILPIYSELEERCPERFMHCLFKSYVFLYIVFSIVMVCGYVAFGPQVESNLLDAMPNDLWAQAARFAMGLCLLGCYPLNVKPLVAPFLHAAMTQSRLSEALLPTELRKDDLVEEKDKVLSRLLRHPALEALLSFSIISVVSIISIFCTQLGPLNAWNGALQITSYQGAIPCFLGVFLFGDKLTAVARRAHSLALIALCAMSLWLATLSFADLQNEPQALESSCVWHWDL